MQKALWAANRTKSVYNSVYPSPAKEAELRRIGQMFSRLEQGVSRRPEVFGAGRIIGKRGSRSTGGFAVYLRTSWPPPIFQHIKAINDLLKVE